MLLMEPFPEACIYWNNDIALQSLSATLAVEVPVLKIKKQQLSSKFFYRH